MIKTHCIYDKTLFKHTRRRRFSSNSEINFFAMNTFSDILDSR